MAEAIDSQSVMVLAVWCCVQCIWVPIVHYCHYFWCFDHQVRVHYVSVTKCLRTWAPNPLEAVLAIKILIAKQVRFPHWCCGACVQLWSIALRFVVFCCAIVVELLETISGGLTGFRYVGPQFPTLEFWDMDAFECLCWGALRATAMHRMLRRAKWMFACALSTSYYPDTFRVFDGVYISHDIVWPLENLYYV